MYFNLNTKIVLFEKSWNAYGSRIFIFEGFITFSLLTASSSEISNEGNKIKLASIAIRRVTETSPPRALVPPKFDERKTEKPKKRTIEV